MSPDSDRRYLAALVLMAVFMLGEVIVAFVSGSLALLSDAGHMLSDVGAIGASLWAIGLAARPATGVWTFGWKRAEILSAAGNGITLLVVSGIVGYEAIRRLIEPPSVEGGPVLVVALVGVAVNIRPGYPDSAYLDPGLSDTTTARGLTRPGIAGRVQPCPHLPGSRRVSSSLARPQVRQHVRSTTTCRI